MKDRILYQDQIKGVLECLLYALEEIRRKKKLSETYRIHVFGTWVKPKYRLDCNFEKILFPLRNNRLYVSHARRSLLERRIKMVQRRKTNFYGPKKVSIGNTDSRSRWGFLIRLSQIMNFSHVFLYLIIR